MADHPSADGRPDRGRSMVRYYTRARKVPSLVGKLPDGTRIPGGPYTTLQICCAVGALVVLHQTRGLWGPSGGLADLAIEVGIAAGIGYGIGRFETGIRNPVVIASSALGGLSRPRLGRVGGRPVRPRPIRSLPGGIVVQTRIVANEQIVPLLEPSRVPAPPAVAPEPEVDLVPAPGRRRTPQQLAASTVQPRDGVDLDQPTAADPAAADRTMTAVEQLLARVPTHR